MFLCGTPCFPSTQCPVIVKLDLNKMSDPSCSVTASSLQTAQKPNGKVLGSVVAGGYQNMFLDLCHPVCSWLNK